MMKKLLMVLGSAVGLVVGVGALYVEVTGIPTYEVEKIDLRVEVTPKRVARGQKFATLLCATCHMDPTTGRLTGKKLLDSPPELGVVYSRNITRHPTKGIGSWIGPGRDADQATRENAGRFSQKPWLSRGKGTGPERRHRSPSRFDCDLITPWRPTGQREISTGTLCSASPLLLAGGCHTAIDWRLSPMPSSTTSGMRTLEARASTIRAVTERLREGASITSVVSRSA